MLLPAAECFQILRASRPRTVGGLMGYARHTHAISSTINTTALQKGTAGSRHLNSYDCGKRQGHWTLWPSRWRVHDRDWKRLGTDHHFHRVVFEAPEVLYEPQLTLNRSGSGGGIAGCYVPVSHTSEQESEGQPEACAPHRDYCESRGGPTTGSFVSTCVRPRSWP